MTLIKKDIIRELLGIRLCGLLEWAAIKKTHLLHYPGVWIKVKVYIDEKHSEKELSTKLMD